MHTGVWSQRQSRTTISGLTLTQHFWIKPVADGILKVETDDPTLRGSDITMQELGTNFVIITATSKRSGERWHEHCVVVALSLDASCCLYPRSSDAGGDNHDRR